MKPFESAFYPRFCWRHYAAHPRLLYAAPRHTVPTGQVISKEDDLAAHRAKLLRLDRLDVQETHAYAIGGMILTTTKAILAGHFDGTAFEGAFAYTRLWRQSSAGWRVVAGHASQVA
ncbi:nuclear transport factor 2 family protein [Burkholderia contaminans]|uniref:nuclear transport factor 2 family protein n=1 Tax=Burkholderia contaminans TaxID=488447 RepID=UPI001C945EED|nr:nuclear transport factor 2 family protein [Burkholderia contaminans]MBY4686601.1 nuclear transport factor 2 family protein [Burkholderia contaminans]